jgi:hypothetical protein
MNIARLTKPCRRAAWGGTLGLAVLLALAPAGAWAGDDDDGEKTFDQKVLDTVLKGIGLRGGDDQIDYRERSPLVVPPSRDLPPPQASAPERDPNWPVDPDVKRAKEIAAKRKSGSDFDPDTFGDPLRPSQLAGRSAAGGKVGPSANGDADGGTERPSQLGYFGGLSLFGSNDRDEVGTFTREPTRRSLTMPPAGYQTPSPAQPYGVTKRIEYGPAKKAEDIPVGD